MTTEEKNLLVQMLIRKNDEYRKFDIRTEKESKSGSRKPIWHVYVFELSRRKQVIDGIEAIEYRPDEMLFYADWVGCISKGMELLSIIRIQEDWGERKDMKGHPCIKIW